MDADKRSNFIKNNKSINNDVATAVKTSITNGSNSQTSINGTINTNSESSESIEPLKRPFNENANDEILTADTIEQFEDGRSREIFHNDLSEKLESNNVSKLPALANSRPQSHHNGEDPFEHHSSIDNDEIEAPPRYREVIDNIISSHDNNCGAVNDGKTHNSVNCINNRDNKDIDSKSTSAINRAISTNNSIIETKRSSIDQSNSKDRQICSSASLEPISSGDCVSSTETFSSDSIDVKPTKSPTSQTASENYINSKKFEKYSDESVVIESKSQISDPNMDNDDNSLRIPLLGKGKINGNNSIDYNAIERNNRTKDNGISKNSNGKPMAYNEYVNLLCNTDKDGNGQKPSDSYDTNTNNHQKYQHKSSEKLRGIVKSPSTQNFGSNASEKFCDANRKPRLSIQIQNTGSDPQRPTLHVQFLSQNENANNTNGFMNTILNSCNYSPPSGDHDGSYQNSIFSKNNSIEKPPEELINQVPTRGILRTSRPRSSISSSSSESSSSSSSDSSSSDVVNLAEAKPPDGGYGWVIVFASFVVNLIADGITFSFGVIYIELLKYFGEGKAKTAWIGSLFMAIPLLSGPIASWLTDRFGCRKVTIVGSILAAICFVISSFTDSVEMLMLTFSAAGFGLSLCYVAAVVIVAYYFDKKRSFATGLSVCGSGIGTFIFAPLTQYLIDEYGWRGTTLILAGMFLNMTVCGMLMKDLEWTTYKSKQKAKLRRKRNKFGNSADSFSVSNSTNTGGTTSILHKDDPNSENERNEENSDDNDIDNYDDPRLFSSLITLPTFVKNGEKVPVEVLELMSANKNVHSVLLKNYPGLAHSRSFSQPLTSSRHSNGSNNHPFESSLSPTSPSDGNDTDEAKLTRSKSRRVRNEQAFLKWLEQDPNVRHTKEVHIMNRIPTAYLKDIRMHRHSLTYRGAMLNINRYRLRASSCPDIYRNSMTTIAKEKTQWSQGLAEFKSILVDMLDFSFFTDIRFTLFAISNFLLYAWYDVPYVYLADYAVENGNSKTDASILISMIGIINMVGEIILGWLGDQKFVSAGMIYAICHVFCGIVTGLMPLFQSFWGLSMLSGGFGLFIAANYSLTSIILVEIINIERFTSGYGLLLLAQGIANLIGPPLAGWITDMTGTYVLAFYLAGFFIAISGIFMMLLPARGKIRKYRAFRRRCQSSGDEDEEEDDDDDDDTDIEQPRIV